MIQKPNGTRISRDCPGKQNQQDTYRYLRGDLSWELAQTIMESELCHNMLSAASGMIQFEAQGPRTWSGQGDAEGMLLVLILKSEILRTSSSDA